MAYASSHCLKPRILISDLYITYAVFHADVLLMSDKVSYYSPPGGLPPQTQLLSDRAFFNTAYVMIPRGVLSDITASFLPFWHHTRLWILARPMSVFAETFSHYIMEVGVGGGSQTPDQDSNAQAVIFVVEGCIELAFEGQCHQLHAGGYAYVPCQTAWILHNASDSRAVFHWIRKKYQWVDGIEKPPALVTSDQATVAVTMPATDGVWATSRFVEANDMRHDMQVNIVTFKPGGVIPFAETHVMEHGLYILQGKGACHVNQDWVEVIAGDYLWLRAFCPQACFASCPEDFRYLLYKDVNRHAELVF